MKQCLMWMRWKMPEKWCTFFPPIPIFICQQLFFVSLLIYFLKSNINWITSSAIYYHQLLLLYIDANPIKKTKARNFLKIKKTTTVAWNCLCFTLIYYQSSFMLLRTTIYWQIGIKKIEISFQHKNCIAYYCLHSLLWWLMRI